MHTKYFALQVRDRLALVPLEDVSDFDEADAMAARMGDVIWILNNDELLNLKGDIAEAQKG